MESFTSPSKPEFLVQEEQTKLKKNHTEFRTLLEKGGN